MTHFLKGLYQLGRLLTGKPYVWDFKLNVGVDNSGIATSQELIRTHIRDVIEPFSQPVYDALKTAYKSQIRNSIAHSNYSFLGRNIHPNNSNENAGYAQISSLSFDDWVEMFNATLLLHDSYNWFKNEINSYYSQLADENGNKLEIQINKLDGSTVYTDVSYRSDFNDWRWSK